MQDGNVVVSRSNRAAARRSARALLLLGALLGCATADAAARQPFTVGEVLNYSARIGALASGRGEMRVEAREVVRGRETVVLHFDFRGGVGPVRMSGSTRSWFDMQTMSAMRFHRQERSPLGTSTEQVEIYPAEGVWRAADGRQGALPSKLPLDELSFLYHIRTLPLPNGAVHRVERHFDVARNPVVITVVGRADITVPAGTFSVVIVEMRVPDGQHVESGSAIRLFLTDDQWRVPVRIETAVRYLGRVVFSLESGGRHAAVAAR